MRCPNCGGPLLSTHRFCPNCAGPAPSHPVPPNFQWGLLLVLEFISRGIAVLLWSFYEALFVKKIDPKSRGVFYLTLSLAIAGCAVILGMLGASLGPDLKWPRTGPLHPDFGAAGMAMVAVVVAAFAALLAGLVCFELAFLDMRRSLVAHYNTVEPIGLDLSVPMTLFFKAIYLQFHFSRIARWRKTGVLD